MAIEISEFANVVISIAPTGVASGNFGILGFLTKSSDAAIAGKEIFPAERTRAYTSLASVLGDWEASSEVYKAASAFYGQTPKPRDFVVLTSYDTAQNAALTGGGTKTAEELIGASWNGSGVLNITIDGTAITISDLDVSAASPATLEGIAAELTSSIDAVASGAEVIHNGYQFVVIGTVAGASGSMTYADYSDAAADLGLTAASAKLSQGLDVETAVDSLAAVATKGTEYVGLVTHKDWRDDSAGVLDSGNSTEDIAMFAQGASKIFCNTTNDLTTLTSGTSHVAARLKSRSLDLCLTTFSRDVTAYPSASVFGRAASVNFSGINSTITLNLKRMPGIDSEDLTPAEFAHLRSHFASAIVQIGKGVNARNGFTDSRMASGSWLDTAHGLLWLDNHCEVAMFNLMYVNNTKIPFTQVGINTAVATLERALRDAVRNGLAAPGYLPDGTYLPEGFIVEYVALADVPVGDKGNRVYKGLSFKMVGAGALHELEVNGEFSE